MAPNFTKSVIWNKIRGSSKGSEIKDFDPFGIRALDCGSRGRGFKSLSSTLLMRTLRSCLGSLSEPVSIASRQDGFAGHVRGSSADMRTKRSGASIVSTKPELVSHSVYILYSNRFDRFYVGVIVNLSKRLLQHNNKENSYTAGGVPWIIIWKTSKDPRFKAETLERKLKNLTRKRKIRFMKKYAVGTVHHALLHAIPQKNRTYFYHRKSAP